MQNKDKEINPKGKEIESEKITPKESRELSDEGIIKINFEEFLKTPEADKKIDLSVKGILDDTKETVEPILTSEEIALLPDVKLEAATAHELAKMLKEKTSITSLNYFLLKNYRN